ncbi:MAG: hypothetical protein RRZ73_02715 [Oscillospiraceae bacterium]
MAKKDDKTSKKQANSNMTNQPSTQDCKNSNEQYSTQNTKQMKNAQSCKNVKSENGKAIDPNQSGWG